MDVSYSYIGCYRLNIKPWSIDSVNVKRFIYLICDIFVVHKGYIMKKLLLVLVPLALLASPILLSADSSSVSHRCTQPKPYDLVEDLEELGGYKASVEKYKECIQAFVDEQNDAIRNHEKAANRAIEEWNHFTKYN